MTWTYRIEQDMIRGEPVAVITDGTAYLQNTLEELAAWHITTSHFRFVCIVKPLSAMAAWAERDDLRQQLNGGW